MSRIAAILATAVSGLLLGGPARGEYLFVFDQSAYTVLAGGTVNVQVLLRETTTSILSTDGLITAGVRVDFDDPVPAQPARVLSPADIMGNPVFDGGTTRYLPPDVPINNAGLMEVVDIASPAVTTFTGQLLLATFTFHAGTVPGEVTRIRATDLFPPPSDDTVTDSGMALDALIGEGQATIQILPGNGMAVTEPGSLALLGLGALGLLGWAWRRRQRAA